MKNLKKHVYHPLTAVSAIDGRYASATSALGNYFSEYALIKNRVIVEINWLKFLSNGYVKEIPRISSDGLKFLDDVVNNFDVNEAVRVKDIEKVTNHDVKAVEYYLKEKAAQNSEIKKVGEFFHFACTSEDINNLSYALMLKGALNDVIVPSMKEVISQIKTAAVNEANVPMLSRTHGQSATPTTVGKEMANFAYRLNRPFQLLSTNQIPIYGKMNGAVGNFAAHMVAVPEVNW